MIRFAIGSDNRGVWLELGDVPIRLGPMTPEDAVVMSTALHDAAERSGALMRGESPADPVPMDRRPGKVGSA